VQYCEYVVNLKIMTTSCPKQTSYRWDGKISLCAYFVLQTKTAQIVGVAGTDVPVEDIKKLLLLHEVSVVQYFFIIKLTRCTNFTNLFWHEILHVFGQFLCPSSGVYSLYTQ